MCNLWMKREYMKIDTRNWQNRILTFICQYTQSPDQKKKKKDIYTSWIK